MRGQDDLPPIVSGRVSVIIVNYNGYEYVRRCVEAVLANCYPDFEIIVVDNGSTDSSVERLLADFPGLGVRFVPLQTNLGPSAARNRAARIATGEFFAFLDNDTKPDGDWLVVPVERMNADPSIGAIQCRLMLLREPNRFDYVGDYLGTYGFLIQSVYAGEEDVGQADSESVILSAKSAGMLVRRSAFVETGGFDDDYFIYVEETDLGLRLWLMGYRAIYVPESRVLHEFGTSSVILGHQQNALAKFHGTKNYVLTLLKNLETRTLLRILPRHISLWCGYAVLNLAQRRWQSSGLILAGLWWNVTHLGPTLKKRRLIQRRRRVNDRTILEIVGRKDSLRALYAKATAAKSIGNYTANNREAGK